jgi:hypothetical protein
MRQAMASHLMPASCHFTYRLRGQAGQETLGEEGPADSMSIKEVQQARETLFDAPETSLTPRTSLPWRIELKVTGNDQ